MAGIDGDLGPAVEHPGHRVGRAEVTVEPREDVPDLRDRSSGVVGRRLDEDRGAPRAVALVGHLLVLDPLELTGALLDGALDVVERHVLGLRGFDGGAEPGVPGGVAAALARGDGDLADDFGERGTAFGVGHRFFSFDLLPLTVAGHGAPLQTRSTLPDGTLPEVRVRRPRATCKRAVVNLSSSTYNLTGRPRYR